MADTVTTKLPHRLKPSAFIAPAAILAVVVLILGGKAIGAMGDKGPLAEPTAASTISDAVQQGVASALAKSATATSAPPTVSNANYDYLTCTHMPAHPTPDQPPCVPLIPWPLTAGAKTIIGYQAGDIDGELNTSNTRSLAEQIRGMVGVDPCAMWLDPNLGDKSTRPLPKIWPGQQQAPEGSAKMFDCSPRAGSTAGSIPTVGQS